MRVLVTGATGFVGRHLLGSLLARGHQVSATHRGERAPTVADVHWHRVEAIGPATDWSAPLRDVDTVVHLAALAHQLGRRGEGRWSEFHAVNTEGTARLASAIRTAGIVQRFIFVSSIGAVSSGSERVLDEQTACEPSTDYGRSKRAAEIAVAEQLRGGSVSWCILRPPLVYGPANPGNMARLMRLIGSGRPLPFARIDNRRSFIYVDNFVDALLTCAVSRAGSGETFFVTDGTDMSTAQLCMLLAKHLQLPARLWAMPLPVLKAIGVTGDVIGALVPGGIGVDTYSVQRLIGSLSATGARFRETFSWHPPFTPERAIAATCAAATAREGQGQ